MALHVSIVLIKKNTISTCQENERQQTPSPFHDCPIKRT